jgi:hypothetical protein
MTTVTEIRNSINIEDLRREDEFGLTDNNLIDSKFYMLIWEKIRRASVKNDTNESRKGITLSYSYYFSFDNEELLNSLRQLYVCTKNSFAKKVIATVGQNKRMTEKQTTIIIEEMMKFNLTLNF